MESYPPKYDAAAYIEQHLQDASRSALILSNAYGNDFHSFFYRPNFDKFLRHEILPLIARSPNENLTFLDTDHWLQKHPFNFPGPFYAGLSDTCGTGDSEAPENILYDTYTQEYVFRQPSNYLELVCVIDAGAVEVLDSYSSNGNNYWTYTKCKEWWSARFDLIEQFRAPEIEKVNGKDRAVLYTNYLSSTAETDLRKYCYFLENGRFPDREIPLPPL
jgi:hypothetical protein